MKSFAFSVGTSGQLPNLGLWKPPAVTWSQRFAHLAAESAHRTASAAWALGDATLGKANVHFSQNAQTARAYHASQAEQHLDQAQALGAVVHWGQLKNRADGGDYLLSSASRSVVPAAMVFAGARSYGLIGATGALYALNTAYNLEDQFNVGGSADSKKAGGRLPPARPFKSWLARLCQALLGPGGCCWAPWPRPAQALAKP